MTIRLTPIVLGGGSGSRLWPLSRQFNPKQFLALGNDRLSMLQATIGRLQGLETALPRLICNEEHRFLAAEQMRRLGTQAGPSLSNGMRHLKFPKKVVHVP